ncbi:MAG: hypothetical protein ABI091_11655 [Ferruginibacter sp.]
MKKKEKKVLKKKMIVAVKKVLTNNDSVLMPKIEKAVKNSLRMLNKKTKVKSTTKKKPAVAK